MAGAPRLELIVACAMCGRPFKTGIYGVQGTPEVQTMDRQIHECPLCGFVAAYAPQDHTPSAG